jgi:phosphohistidine phosphatase SixA
MIRVLTLCVLALCARPALADDAAWEAFRAPGAVAVMRHALAPGTGDPAGFDIADCATQRNLDAAGRAQARAIGDALRARGVAFDRVLTSAWCRCAETAALLDLGPVEVFPALNSVFAGRSGGTAAQTAEVEARIAGRGSESLLMVTHQVNISALTGRSTASGETLVIADDGAGGFAVTGSIRIDP